MWVQGFIVLRLSSRAKPESASSGRLDEGAALGCQPQGFKRQRWHSNRIYRTLNTVG